ncbi:hypothetical protein M0Q97_09875 [Candidatus Dojkabacteria bacterium]|jgi:predicted nucleotidyltransferase|nr:hypothetical protein [Candidatus Dojkabacteria bacterium]
MKKFTEFVIERMVSYQKNLCPDIWDGNKMIERIETKLLRIARDFYDDLDIKTDIKDIQLTGSIANYNYTSNSDLDVHIIIDFSEINDDIELVKKAFDGQRFMWNLRHHIVIKGHDVELYVQDINEEHVTSGLYSLMNHKWIKESIYNRPNVDTKDVDDKYEVRAYDIDELTKISKSKLDSTEAEEYYNKAKELKSKIMKSRKEGLSASGEFSIENLVFKKLRNSGKLEKLINVISNFYDKIYSQ